MAVAATRKLTLEEYARLPDDGTRRELDEGELVMMTFPNLSHTRRAMRLAYRLGPWVEDRELGEVLVEAGFVLQRDPPILRGPDAAFVRAARGSTADEDGWIEGSPDMAVEVVSPSDRTGDLQRKIKQYLDFGSTVVLTLHPRERIVRIHRSGAPIATIGAGELLEIQELFPGWSMPVKDLFKSPV